MDVNLSHLSCGQVKDLETHLQRLKSDLHNCVSFIQEPRKLKDSVQMIYARYVPQLDGVSSSYIVDPLEIISVYGFSTHKNDLLRVVIYIYCEKCREYANHVCMLFPRLRKAV